jgi:hypothetical protein
MTMKRFMWMLLLIVALAGCGGKEGIPADAALKITGHVNNETGWTDATLRAMKTIETELQTESGSVAQYTGVPLTRLLEKAEPMTYATMLTFVTTSGRTAAIPLADARSCQRCVLALLPDALGIVMPGYPDALQLKGVIEFQVE